MSGKCRDREGVRPGLGNGRSLHVFVCETGRNLTKNRNGCIMVLMGEHTLIPSEVQPAFRRLVLEGRTVRYIRNQLGLTAGSDAPYICLMLNILRGVTNE